MDCSNLENCDNHLSVFVYNNACTGKLRFVYCPLLKKGPNFRTPREWKKVQSSKVME